jgi:hypothetical protein
VNELQKMLHILVVFFFALQGVVLAWQCLAVAFAGLKTALSRDQVYHAMFDFIIAVLFLAVSAGLYRFDPRARFSALVLVGLELLALVLGALAGLNPVSLLWLAPVILVLTWLLSPPVRAQFLAAEGKAKAA